MSSSSSSDSPLAITGNLISLLTFLLGLAASYLTFFTLTRDAISEIAMFKQDLDTTRTQLLPVLDCCSSEACLAPVRIHDREGALEKSIEALVSTLDSLYRELEDLQMKHQEGGTWWARRQLCKRLRWVYKRKEISQRVARISGQKMEVYVTGMSLLLRKLAAREHRLVTQNVDVIRRPSGNSNDVMALRRFSGSRNRNKVSVGARCHFLLMNPSNRVMVRR